MPTFISHVPEMQVRAEQIRLQRLAAGDDEQADGPNPYPIIQQNAIMEAANEELRDDIRHLREIQRRQLEGLAQQQQRLQDNLKLERIRQLRLIIGKKKELITTMQEKEREAEELERLSEQKLRLEDKRRELQHALDERAAVTERVEVLKDRLQTRKSIYAHEVKRVQAEEEERRETLLRRQAVGKGGSVGVMTQAEEEERRETLLRRQGVGKGGSVRVMTQAEEEERRETLLRRQRLRMRHGFRSSYFWHYDDL